MIQFGKSVCGVRPFVWMWWVVRHAWLVTDDVLRVVVHFLHLFGSKPLAVHTDLQAEATRILNTFGSSTLPVSPRQ